MVVAESVTGIDAKTLARASRLDLLDSALHAPQAGFGEDDFYPDFVTKAAVLVVRIVRNHPLLDGNKRLAWMSLVIFCALNGFELAPPAKDAVEAMIAIAGGEWDESQAESWLTPRIVAMEDPSDR